MATVSLQQAFEQARNWIESNDPERAIGLTRHILEYHPNNLDAYCILGESYLANRQLDEAQEAFERVLSSDPESIPAHVGLGITFERQGIIDRAVSEFEQAWEIKPDLPELRSQLLRLYTDAWGSEQAQLRLSRSGLARLYAKGHMLPQAIEEFRQVITDQPDRLDARVALAEALWRDGQEDDAIAESKDILSQYPQALKANLILGYLKMSSGEPEGQHFWDTASQLDPYHVVGRALFDALPVDDQPEPSVEEWDETAWETQQSLQAQEHAPATRPMAVTAVTDILASTSESELLSSEQENVPSSSFSSLDNNNDDFLNELLNLDVVDTSSEDNTRNANVIPSDDQFLNSTPSGSEVDTTDIGVTPFSLEELGLSQAEIDSLDSLGGEAKADASFATGESDANTPESSSASAMEADVAPFSLEELGLSQAEIDSLDSLGGEAKADTPFATGEGDANTPESGDASAMEADLAPFSLEELGLSQAEIDSLDDLQSDPRANEVDDSKPHGFESSIPAIDSTDISNEVPSELQPFSLDEIDMKSVDGESVVSNDLSSSLQPFSLDDAVANIENEDRDVIRPESGEQIGDDSPSQTQGYSWQEPTQRSERNFLSSDENANVEEGLSIFAKLKQRKQSDPSTSIDESEPHLPLAEEVSQEADDDVSLFSVDNISLRDDSDVDNLSSLSAEADTSTTEPSQSSREFESLEAAISSGEVQPFSLSDLGLSEDEIAALGLGEEAQPDNATSDVQESIKTDSDQTIEDVLSSVPEAVNIGLDDNKDVVQDSIDLTAQEEIDLEVDTSESEATSTNEDSLMSDLKPFSLSDLGLSDDEIAALGLGASETDDVAATGLGITEDELAGLDIGGETPDELKSIPPASSIDFSEESASVIEEPALETDPVIDQLVSLGRRQGFIDIADIIAHFEDPEAEADRIEEVGRVLHEANIQIRDGDEIIDMNDEYADDIEDDLGEISSAPSQYESLPVEPDMTPFSLSELGLSDDEIASLGIESSSNESDITFGDDQSLSSAPQSTNSFSSSDTLGVGDTGDDVHPFSFTELNLSDDIDSNTNQPDTTSKDIDLGALIPLDEQKDNISDQSNADLPRQGDLIQQPSSQNTQGHFAKIQPDSEQTDSSVSPELNMYMDRLAAEPDNHILRLSLARISGQIGSTDIAVQQYKQLIKNNVLLDEVVEDLQDLMVDVDQTDRRTLQRLHRTLGDAYSKQGRFQEAMEEYSWTFSGNTH